MDRRSAPPPPPGGHTLGFPTEVWHHLRGYLGQYPKLGAVSPELRRFLDKPEAWVRFRRAELRLDTEAEVLTFLFWPSWVWSEAGVQVTCLTLGCAALRGLDKWQGESCPSGLVVDEVRISHNHNGDLLTRQSISAMGRAFPYIRALNLSSHPRVTIGVIRGLAELRNLQKLDLTNVKFNVAALALLQPQRLQWLALSCVTDEKLQYLRDLSSLQELRLACCFQLIGNQMLPPMPSLQRLDIRSCGRLTRDTLLQGLDSLQELDLSNCTSLQTLENLPPLSNLETLILNNCTALPDDSLRHLAGLNGLRTLDLSFCAQFDDGSLQYLAGLGSLRELRLSFCTRLTDAALRHCRGLRSLQTLYLKQCTQLTDAALRHCWDLPKLRELRGCSRFSDAAIQQLHDWRRDHNLLILRDNSGSGGARRTAGGAEKAAYNKHRFGYKRRWVECYDRDSCRTVPPPPAGGLAQTGLVPLANRGPGTHTGGLGF
eukprot:g77643.t1